MSKHTITVKLASGELDSGEVPSPERIAQAGDVYVVKRYFYTLGKREFNVGDKMEILSRTNQRPHNRWSSLGNCLVKSSDLVSVWTNIDWMIAEGTIELCSSI